MLLSRSVELAHPGSRFSGEISNNDSLDIFAFRTSLEQSFQSYELQEVQVNYLLPVDEGGQHHRA